MRVNEHTGASDLSVWCTDHNTDNAFTALSTGRILLVPYSQHHVPTYHEWMEDGALQAATASEPLSIDEEYAMQRSWRNDRDKLTFIICLPLDSSSSPTQAAAITQAIARVDDASDRMIGDINLFLFPPDCDEMAADVQEVGGSIVGEVELMIARKDFRQKGYGRAALLTFLEYTISNWSLIGSEYGQQQDTATTEGDHAATPQLAFLRVKIHQTNLGSIRLFESVGFVRTVEDANYFGEVELRWLPDVAILRRQAGHEKANELKYVDSEVSKVEEVSF